MRIVAGWLLFAWRFEVALYRSLFRWVTRRPAVPAGTTAVPYVGAVSLLLWAFTIGSAVELVALHVILPWEHVRLIADVIGIWGLLWMLGFTASHYVYPHLVGPTGLRLRSGHHVAVDVPWDAVARATSRERGTEESRILQTTTACSPSCTASRTNVELRLARPIDVPVRGTTRSVTEVRFFADDPRDVVQRVNREVSARSGGSR